MIYDELDFDKPITRDDVDESVLQSKMDLVDRYNKTGNPRLLKYIINMLD